MLRLEWVRSPGSMSSRWQMHADRLGKRAQRRCVEYTLLGPQQRAEVRIGEHLPAYLGSARYRGTMCRCTCWSASRFEKDSPA